MPRIGFIPMKVGDKRNNFSPKYLIMPQTKVLPDQLMNSVLGKLYDILTMGDDSVPRSSDDFFSWCTPGIPYDEDQFDFLSQGFTAMVRNNAAGSQSTDDNGSNSKAADEPSMKEKMGQQTAELYQEAENLARLVDFIPSVSGIEDGKRRQNVMTKIWSPDASLSNVYEYVLRMSQVISSELDDKTKAKVERLRGLLVEKTKKVDLITDEEIEVTEPSEIVKRYYEKMMAYEDAVLDYNNRRISANSGTSPEAVQYFAMNARTLRNRVRAAYNDWVANGYKEDYEKISAYISQVMSRDLTLLKAEYRDDLEKAALTGLASNSDFYYTSLLPGNFARSRGWTEFEFTQSDFESHYDQTKKDWGTKGGFRAGFFRIGGGGGGSKTEVNSDIDWSSFSLNFEMAQVPIVRPWFHQEFLKSRYWRFHPDAKKTGQGDLLSDGKIPPKGMLTSYPTAIIFVRNLNLNFKTYSGSYESVEKQFQGGGGFSLGPFNAGGNYKSEKNEINSERHFTRQGIKIPGMQICGFRCHILSNLPNPVTSIKDEKWV